jgi:hypothetical protein
MRGRFDDEFIRVWYNRYYKRLGSHRIGGAKVDITLPLEHMSTEEKIRAMEAIWDDLCKKADSLSSPTWHKNVLAEREEQIKNGEDEFMDWEQAKKQNLSMQSLIAVGVRHGFEIN